MNKEEHIQSVNKYADDLRKKAKKAEENLAIELKILESLPALSCPVKYVYAHSAYVNGSIKYEVNDRAQALTLIEELFNIVEPLPLAKLSDTFVSFKPEYLYSDDEKSKEKYVEIGPVLWAMKPLKGYDPTFLLESYVKINDLVIEIEASYKIDSARIVRIGENSKFHKRSGRVKYIVQNCPEGLLTRYWSSEPGYPGQHTVAFDREIGFEGIKECLEA